MLQQRIVVSALGLLFALSLSACDSAVTKKSLDTDKEKLSYTIGAQIGTGLRRDDIELDMNAFRQGIEDGKAEKELLLSDTDMQQVMIQQRTAMMEARNSKIETLRASGEKNKMEGEKFLAENKKKEGVVTLKSGLQYKIVKKGEGESPKQEDVVVAHYRGTLLDGTEFDSSHKRGQPASFPLNRVIKGWQEVLQLMKPGSKWEVFIPSDLAYGKSVSGEKIGPDSTLIFDIELLEVKKSDAATPKVSKSPKSGSTN